MSYGICFAVIATTRIVLCTRGDPCPALHTVLYKQHSPSSRFLPKQESGSCWPVCTSCPLLCPRLLDHGLSVQYIFVGRRSGVLTFVYKDAISGSSSLGKLSSSPENKANEQARANSGVRNSEGPQVGAGRGRPRPTCILVSQKPHSRSSHQSCNRGRPAVSEQFLEFSFRGKEKRFC